MARWSDGARWTLESRLEHLLRDLEHLTAEAERREREKELREAEQRRRWYAAVSLAREQQVEPDEHDASIVVYAEFTRRMSRPCLRPISVRARLVAPTAASAAFLAMLVLARNFGLKSSTPIASW
ncbi:hypothetical protein [Streptomyces phaeochromogenes]|uniref:hypothetical protein n=1 Tax=Streptomyces phaeochromogenes TaxID=1923 RepID=UPI003719B6E5